MSKAGAAIKTNEKNPTQDSKVKPADKNQKTENPPQDAKGKPGNAPANKAPEKGDKNAKAGAKPEKEEKNDREKNRSPSPGQSPGKSKTPAMDKGKKPGNEVFLTERKSHEITIPKPENVLVGSGLLDAYDYLQKQICKNGLPKGNVYEYAAITLLKYERKLKAEEADKRVEVANKELEDKLVHGDHHSQQSPKSPHGKGDPKDQNRGRSPPVREEEVKGKGKNDKSPPVREEEIKGKGKNDKSPPPKEDPKGKDKNAKGGKEEPSRSPPPKDAKNMKSDSVIDPKKGQKEPEPVVKGKKK